MHTCIANILKYKFFKCCLKYIFENYYFNRNSSAFLKVSNVVFKQSNCTSNETIKTKKVYIEVDICRLAQLSLEYKVEQ